MADVINLRQARKARARADAARVAQANRMKHGQPKSERQRTSQELGRVERLLEGARREDE